MTNIKVVSRTQRIVVNPANGSVSVINAGPMGPAGPVGPSEASLVLTTNGDILTRAAGVLARITRASLAADAAFAGAYQPLDSDLTAIAALTTTSYGRALLTAANSTALAAESSFTSKYMVTVAHGSTAATARVGTAPCLWVGTVSPTNVADNDLLFRTDQHALYLRLGGGYIEVGSGRYALAPTTWAAVPTFQNSWVNYGGVQQVAQYRNEGTDLIRLRGAVKNGTIGTIITTLPLGSRPPGQVQFQGPGIAVTTGGDVYSQSAQNTLVDLSSVCFSIT